MGNGYHNSGYGGPAITQPMVHQDLSDEEFYARFEARMLEAIAQGTFDHG